MTIRSARRPSVWVVVLGWVVAVLWALDVLVTGGVLVLVSHVPTATPGRIVAITTGAGVTLTMLAGSATAGLVALWVTGRRHAASGRTDGDQGRPDRDGAARGPLR